MFENGASGHALTTYTHLTRHRYSDIGEGKNPKCLSATLRRIVISLRHCLQEGKGRGCVCVSVGRSVRTWYNKQNSPSILAVQSSRRPRAIKPEITTFNWLDHDKPGTYLAEVSAGKAGNGVGGTVDSESALNLQGFFCRVFEPRHPRPGLTEGLKV
ncbi:hypothetical protein PoB_005786400 [Plakobranchus ocellatus]|uniref:Uncharacterized protein n=1 Tax=Plakobranchus ocellatus TaxID=259542 RepID=A0AAV4CJN5_9GAST|nr:hypothetical protein PoB_005786400 [Plakobranchus ocellatus]